MKKHLILSLMTVALLSACGISQQAAQEKRAAEERVAMTVQQMLDDRSFEIDINYMVPLRGGARAVTNYSVKVDDSTLNSHLPYVGNASSLPYGGGKGLTFEDKIESYTDQGWEKDRRTIVVKVKNEEDTYVYTIEIFNNGVANVRVNSRNRDDISYMGRLELDKKKAED